MLSATMVALLLSQARAPSLLLEWREIQGCPDREWLVTEIARLRGAVDVREKTGGEDVAARIAPEFVGGHWVIEVRTHSSEGDGFRRIDAESCFRGAETAAIVVSLALAPFAPPSGPERPATAPPVLPAVNATPEPAAAETGLRLRPSVAAIAASRLGPLPSATFTAAIAIAVRPGAWKIEAQIHAPVAEQLVPNARLTLPLSGGLSLCRMFGGETVELAACAALDAGWMHSEGRDLTNPLSGDALWLALLGALSVQVNVYGPVAVRFDGALGGALSRPRFLVGETPKYESRVFNARATAGLEVRW